MPTEEKQQEGQDQQQETASAKYKLLGSKTPGERVDRVVLEGTAMNPERYIDRDGEAELTEEEASDLRKRGYNLKKSGEADNEGEPQGDAPVVETKEDQQEAQKAAPVGPPVPPSATASSKRKS